MKRDEFEARCRAWRRHWRKVVPVTFVLFWVVGIGRQIAVAETQSRVVSFIFWVLSVWVLVIFVRALVVWGLYPFRKARAARYIDGGGYPPLSEIEWLNRRAKWPWQLFD